MSWLLVTCIVDKNTTLLFFFGAIYSSNDFKGVSASSLLPFGPGVPVTIFRLGVLLAVFGSSSTDAHLFLKLLDQQNHLHLQILYYFHLFCCLSPTRHQSRAHFYTRSINLQYNLHLRCLSHHLSQIFHHLQGRHSLSCGHNFLFYTKNNLTISKSSTKQKRIYF